MATIDTDPKIQVAALLDKLDKLEIRKQECEKLLWKANAKLIENCEECGHRLLSCDDDETWDNIEELESEIADIDRSMVSLWKELAGFDSKQT